MRKDVMGTWFKNNFYTLISSYSIITYRPEWNTGVIIYLEKYSHQLTSQDYKQNLIINSWITLYSLYGDLLYLPSLNLKTTLWNEQDLRYYPPFTCEELELSRCQVPSSTSHRSICGWTRCWVHMSAYSKSSFIPFFFHKEYSFLY